MQHLDRKTAWISIQVLDLAEARRYLRSTAALCEEGATSRDSRVTTLALQVLEREPENLRRLMRRIA